MSLKLQDDSTHFYCAGCSRIYLTKDGHIAKVAYSTREAETQDKFYYYPYHVMLCTSCFEGKEVEKKGEKDDRDNNSE